MEKCPKCDNVLKNNQKFCTKCGTKIEDIKKTKLSPDILAKIDILQKKILNDNLNTTLYIELGDVYFENEMFKEAILEYQKAYSIDNKNFDSIFKTAETYRKMTDFEKAETSYLSAMELNPKSQEAKLGLFWSYSQQEKIEKMINLAKDITDDLKSVNFHISLKKAYKKFNDNEQSFREMEIIDKLDPENVENLRDFAEYFYEKDYEKSITYYNKILSIDPNNIESIFIVGKDFCYKKNYKQTIMFFEKNLTNFPDHTSPIAFLYLSYSYLMLENIDKAIDWISNIDVSNISVSSEDEKQIISKTLYELSENCVKRDNFNTAMNYLEKAMKFEPENKKFIDRLSSIKKLKISNQEKIKKQRFKYLFLSIVSIITTLILTFAIIKFINVKKDNSAWLSAKSENSIVSYNKYLSNFPNGKYISEADSLLEKTIWDQAKKKNTIKSYKTYLKDYPMGTYSIEACLLEENILDSKYAFVPKGTYQIKKKMNGKDLNVTVDGFYIGKYEVTYKEYIEFLNSIGYSSNNLNGKKLVNIEENLCRIKFEDKFYFEKNKFIESDNCPINHITWYGAVAYCNWIGGRLPSDDEWQIAAKGGAKSKNYKYVGSNNVNEIAWWDKNANSRLHPVGLKKANELGIFDMAGNVSEWCDTESDYSFYNGSEFRERSGGRVAMGGHIYDWKNYMTPYFRRGENPFKDKYTNHCFRTGFRIVFDSK